MIFEIKHSHNKVKTGYLIAGQILCDRKIQDRLLKVVKLTYTDKTAREVVQALAFHTEAIVSGLAPKIPVLNYYSKSNSVIATTFSDKVGIYVNDRNISSRSLETYIGNGAHEFGHLPMNFGHGSNWSQDSWKGRMMCRVMGDFADKSWSVPYLLASLTVQIAKEEGYI
jgi:hypothetical protein